MATYGCYEIRTWVSGYPSLSLWLVAGSAFPTFCTAGPDSSGLRGSFGNLYSVFIKTLPVSTISQGGPTCRNALCLALSSWDTPQTGSSPTCQEGQVRTL